MMWEKKGLIFDPQAQGLGGWRQHTFITPTPYRLSSEVIRLYGGFRDGEGISRIGYVDVRADNPSVVLRVSERPALDRGKDGMFDDNGVILGSVIGVGNELRMYYVGFQLVKRVKFLAFSGLAISTDGGEIFERLSDTPVLDRYGDENYIRAIHTVLPESGGYSIWYSAGNRWEVINGVPYPQYKIMRTQSADGLHIPQTPGVDALDVAGDEYRIGRPTVFKQGDTYKMFYTRDTLQKKYSSGYAESKDGMTWMRREEAFNLPPSASGWDSEMVCYPVPLSTPYGTYLFYSGNNMGASGVGYAQLRTS